MARSKSKYVVVARRRHFTLSYPRVLWEAMTPEEQEGVVARQAARIRTLEKRVQLDIKR